MELNEFNDESSNTKQIQKKVYDLTNNVVDQINSLQGTSSPNEESIQAIYSISAQLDNLDPNSKDENLQLLIGSIESVVDAYSHIKKNERPFDESFLSRQLTNSARELSSLAKAYMDGNQEVFDHSYVVHLLNCLGLETLESVMHISECLEKLANDLADRETLERLGEIAKTELTQITFAKGTRGFALVSSLIRAIMAIHDFWLFATTDERKNLLSQLQVMIEKILPLLDVPTYSDRDIFKAAFEEIDKIARSTFEEVQRKIS